MSECESDDVIDVVLDRLVAFQVEESLPIYFVVDWPPARLTVYLHD